MESSCCFTGYRPEKFPFELKLGSDDFIKLENKIYDTVFAAVKEGSRVFYCGMAMGFDLLCGKAVADIKKLPHESEISLIAVIPFQKQSEKFAPTWKKLYDLVLENADEIVVLSEQYHKGCFEKRNKYMVDKSYRVITFFDGQSGGTANTVRYAIQKGRKIINLADYDVSEKADYSGFQLELV